MPDTEVEFRKKDRAYFDLIGRTAGVGEWVAKIISYRPASGPRYIFGLQYESGPKRGEEVELQRHEFYVLPQSAPVVTHDVVEAAENAWHEHGTMHAALEAAAPLLGPRPLLDRNALASAYMAFRERNGGCLEGPDCAACRRLAEEEADIALELARPMPTREQIENALLRSASPLVGNGEEVQEVAQAHADAVLALINGGAK